MNVVEDLLTFRACNHGSSLGYHNSETGRLDEAPQPRVSPLRLAAYSESGSSAVARPGTDSRSFEVTLTPCLPEATRFLVPVHEPQPSQLLFTALQRGQATDF